MVKRRGDTFFFLTRRKYENMRLGVNDARFVVSVAGSPFIKVSLFPMKLKARTLLKIGGLDSGTEQTQRVWKLC